MTNHVTKFGNARLDCVPAIQQRPHVALLNDVHVIGRNVLSCVKRFVHLPSEGLPFSPAYEICGYSQPRVAQLILHGRVSHHPPYSKKQHSI